MLVGVLMSGVVLPMVLGISVALLLATARDLRIAADGLLVGLAIILTYLSLEGLPAFPPTAVKQKLFYALLASAVLMPLAARRSHWGGGLLVAVTACFSLVCLFWLPWPILARTAEVAAVAPPIAYAVLVSLAAGAALSVNGDASREPHRLLRLSASLVFCAGSAVIAAIGGFVGMGQMFGALAALTGGIVLVGYVAQLRGNAALGAKLDGVVPAIILPALAIGIVVAFYATSLNMTSHLLMPATLLLAVFLARKTPIDRLPRWLVPLTHGAVLALPAALAIPVATLT